MKEGMKAQIENQIKPTTSEQTGKKERNTNTTHLEVKVSGGGYELGRDLREGLPLTLDPSLQL